MKSESPTVTFLIATHNRRNALLHTLSQLQSLETSQDFRVETIVVDNASSDGTAEAVIAEFPSTRLLKQRTNRGACAKNIGLAQASGEYIVFLDDDSYPDAGSIRRMIEHFQAEPELGATIFDVVLPDGSRECSAFPNVFIGCGTGFRREAIVGAGGLPDDFFMQAEEYDLSLRLLDAAWQVRRFDDLRVRHLKTSSARLPARTTRLDVRNNLLVIVRRFPRQWMWPYAMDWIRRYHWIAQTKDWRHRLAFWRGLLEGMIKSLRPGRRRPVSDGAFERFAMIEQIRAGLARQAREREIRSIVLIDVGKNIFAYWRAAQDLGLEITAIADAKLARPGRQYRGIPIVDDETARTLRFDAAVIANVSPVHASQRTSVWRSMGDKPVIDLFEPDRATAMAA